MTILNDLLERARSLLFRRRDERELAEELRTHAAMEAEHRRQHGTPAAEAHRQSILALGGVEPTKEAVRDARGTRLLDDSLGDVAYTLRTLARSPGFAVIVILTLAIGIGGTTAVFSAVDRVLLQPLPYQSPGQLVRLYGSSVKDPNDRGFLSPVGYKAFRTRLNSMDGVATILTYDEKGADIGTGSTVRRIKILPTSSNYFDVIRVHPAVGQPYQPPDEIGSGIEDNTDGQAKVVLSHQLWEDEFHSDASAIGRTLVMNGRGYTITGVMPDGFTDPVVGAIDAWVPLDLSQGDDPREAGNHYLSVIARLRPGVTIGRAQAEVNSLSLQLEREYPQMKDARARLYPLKEDIVGSSSRSLELMLGAVGLVLLLVCVNVANLMLVRGSERTREFAVRAALGAGGGRLVRQLLIESLTLALAGAVAGLVVARLAMSAMVALSDGNIPRLASLSLDPRLLVFALLVATASAVIFGLTPALRAARTQPGDALRDQSRGATSGRRSMRLREWLVVWQVALAFVLLVGASLLLASFRKISDTPLGVNAANVLTFELNLPSARYDSTARGRFYDDLDTRLETIPGVRAAGGISKLPATGPYHQWGAIPTTGPKAAEMQQRGVGAENRTVSGDYFRAAGIPLVAGRYFNASDDVSAPSRVVISADLARAIYPGVDPIGQSLRTGGRAWEVIGVVGDVSVDNEGRTDFYIYHAHRQFAGDRNWSLTQVVATTGSPTALEPAIRRELSQADPQLVMFRPMTLDAAIGRGAAQRVFTLKMLATFAVVALALAALGLFGVLSYGVKLRSREFGIRMALGADRPAIRRAVMANGLVVAGIGIAIGLAGAVALARTMASLMFHTSPLDPGVLGAAIVFMTIVAAAAAYIPAYRATAVDPRSALQ